MSARKVTAIRGKPVTLQAAADAFLSSPRCENPNTRRAYATVIDKLTAQLDPARELAEDRRGRDRRRAARALG